MTNIEVVESLVPQSVCRELIDLAMPRMRVATVGPVGRRTVVTRVRTCFHVKMHENEVPQANWLRDRIAEEATCAFNLDSVPSPDQMEPVEIAMYAPGGFFARHHDGSHRSHAAVVMLNEGYHGGELRFDDGQGFSGLSAGSVVLWENSDDAYHESTPIVTGLKWIAIVLIKRSD